MRPGSLGLNELALTCRWATAHGPRPDADTENMTPVAKCLHLVQEVLARKQCKRLRNGSWRKAKK